MIIIISNIFGLLALAFLCISYQTKVKSKFLLVQIGANSMYLIQYILLGATSAAAISSIAVCKVILFYIEELLTNKHTKINNVKSKVSKNESLKNKKMYKKIKKRELIEFIIVEVITVIAGILTYETPLSLIPVIISITYTYGIWQKNLAVTYTIGSIVPIGWIIYNTIYMAYTSALGSVVEMIASIIGLIRFRKYKKEAAK